MASLPNINQTKQTESFTPASSFLELATYDAKTYTMTLTFKNGNQYKHLWVFPSVWESFKQSPDHSSYYSKMIKGKMLSVPVKKSNTGVLKSTPLHKHKAQRSLDNGNLMRERSTGSGSSGESKPKRPASGNIPPSLQSR